MITLQNIQAAHAVQYQKNKQPNQKAGRRSKQTFLQRTIYRWPTDTWQDAQHHSLLREMQTKTTVRYHLIPVRMVIIKNTTNSKCRQGCGGKGTLLDCWWECKLIQLLWRTVWRLLKKTTTKKKLGIKPPYDPATPPLGIYPREIITENDTCTPHSPQHYLQQLGHGSNSDVHQQTNR